MARMQRDFQDVIRALPWQEQADKILYPSRHDPKQQLAAIFDRARMLLAVQQHGPLRDYLGDEFLPLLDHYEIALL